MLSYILKRLLLMVPTLIGVLRPGRAAVPAGSSTVHL